MNTVLDLFSLQDFGGYRSALFTGFLTLGGLMVTALGLFITRVHDMMSKASQLEHDGVVLDLFPGTQFTEPLRAAVQLTRRAAALCFTTAMLELGLGLSVWRHAPLVAVLLALGTSVYVTRAVDAFLRSYLAWLDLAEELHREQVKRRKVKTG